MAKIDTSTISVSDGMARSINNDTDIELTGSGGLTNLDFTSDTGLILLKLYLLKRRGIQFGLLQTGLLQD